ncbi:amidohydrolase [Brevundimonas sp. 2R-24]|uniref:Amidohydrolase n=1 Tax=Peiella sedimenti TaxID=3061083 RepID=A0ABT8SNL8_9CAUL|nr:amidohydrolase [Caulobacteraceae bacterium XZ-24]
MRLRSGVAIAALLAAALAACATTGGTTGQTPASSSAASPAPLLQGLDPATTLDPFPSTYQPLPRRDAAIVGATVFTGDGRRFDNGVVVMQDGRITAVGGADTPIPAGAQRIDGRGRFVTPGVIDAHSHLGVYPSPGIAATSDGNEMTGPNQAGVWSEHALWPQDPGFNRAREGGVTTLMILPGSGNLFGGRSVTVRNVPSVSMQGMKFPGAPYGLKMACGENPPRTYGARNQSPATGMGNVAGYRTGWIEAQNYRRRWDEYRQKVERGERADPPTRDLRLETLAGVLSGDILVQNHCYRADEMMLMLDVAREFGYRITTFHHASEAYKIAPVLARENICSAIWGSGWWGFKLESFDGIEENAAILQQAGACVVIHSDDANLIQRLNQETAMAVSAARRAGIEVSDEQAISWFTLNPARALGIADQTGSLTPGKRADVVLWSAHPLSVYARADQVFIDGAVAFDRSDPRTRAASDYELGQPGREPR